MVLMLSEPDFFFKGKIKKENGLPFSLSPIYPSVHFEGPGRRRMNWGPQPRLKLLSCYQYTESPRLNCSSVLEVRHLVLFNVKPLVS
jgi:hypothetical protein